MAIIWDAPLGRREATETPAEVAWRMFLVQTLAGLTEDAEAQVRHAEACRGPLTSKCNQTTWPHEPCT